MALSNLDGTDQFDSVETKLDAVIDDINNKQIKWKVVEIGDWDMDSDQFVEVAHGLTNPNIRVVSAMIRNDANNSFTPLELYVFSGYTGGGLVATTSTIINLGRITGGYYDNTSYMATSYNRGWVTIGYVE